MDEKDEKCAHPSCFCKRTKDSKYCGAYCEGIADHPELLCTCGHAGCVAAAGRRSGTAG